MVTLEIMQFIRIPNKICIRVIENRALNLWKIYESNGRYIERFISYQNQC